MQKEMITVEGVFNKNKTSIWMNKIQLYVIEPLKNSMLILTKKATQLPPPPLLLILMKDADEFCLNETYIGGVT